jgi:DNA-binding CsgD family transcriptional regulator
VPVYQKLSQKIKELKALGMTNQDIANSMKVSRKTVWKGLSSP